MSKEWRPLESPSVHEGARRNEDAPVTQRQNLSALLHSVGTTMPPFLPAAAGIIFVFTTQHLESSTQPWYKTFLGKASRGHYFKPDTLTCCAILREISGSSLRTELTLGI